MIDFATHDRTEKDDLKIYLRKYRVSMPAKWSRIVLTTVPMQTPRGGIMFMAVSAGKHVTAFSRSRRAKGAGSQELKTAFTNAARLTVGTFNRQDRNDAVSRAMAPFKGKVGPHYRISKSKLHIGERYQIGASGYTGGGGRR